MHRSRAVVTAGSHRRRDGERGYVLVTFLVISVVLLSFAGLVVDIGMMEYYKRKVQVAADAGAMGGYADLASGGTNPVATAAADVARNGFTNGAGGAAVTQFAPAQNERGAASSSRTWRYCTPIRMGLNGRSWRAVTASGTSRERSPWRWWCSGTSPGFESWSARGRTTPGLSPTTSGFP